LHKKYFLLTSGVIKKTRYSAQCQAYTALLLFGDI
jgi:hypothetical protein